MKLTKDTLRELKIFNPHNLASRGIGPRVFVVYSPQETGRASQCAKWVVASPDFQTNPKAAGYDCGCKVFIPIYPLNKANKEACRDVALAWAAREYGIKEWERSPFGSYHPKGTLAKIASRCAPAAGK